MQQQQQLGETSPKRRGRRPLLRRRRRRRLPDGSSSRGSRSSSVAPSMFYPAVVAAAAMLLAAPSRQPSSCACCASAFVIGPRRAFIGGELQSNAQYHICDDLAGWREPNTRRPSKTSSFSSSSSSMIPLSARRGRRHHPSDEEHDDIMNYLARVEARGRGGGGSGGLGFEYPNHPNPHPQHGRNTNKGREQHRQKKQEQQRYQSYEYAWSSCSTNVTLHATMLSQRTMSSALSIIPPDEAWDTLQRARHLARDPTYHRWPPAIRLFHPFAPRTQLPSAATAIAELVERHRIEPFEVTLDRLLILPHFEVLEEQVEVAGPSAEMVRRQTRAKGRMLSAEEENRREVQRQIEEEARLSAAKKRRRKARARRREGLPPLGGDGEGDAEGSSSSGGGDTSGGSSNNVYMGGSSSPVTSPGDESPQDVVDRQRSQRSSFNGPCVVCLEPDADSRARLEDLREVLRRELFGPYDAFSASSGVSSTGRLPRIVEEKHRGGGDEKGGRGAGNGGGGATFRPVLTLGRFPTVSRAVEIAKKLQALWEPLTFTVSDLSLISCADSMDATDSSSSSSSPAAGASDFSVRRIRGTEHETESMLLSTRGRYGCDAMVALVGAEGAEDVVGDEDLLNLLLSEAGESGGGGANETNSSGRRVIDYEALLSMSEAEEDVRRRQARVRWDGDELLATDDVGSDGEDDGGWEEWLLDDDEWDEGATIVIGRTQFFMGEARQYVGMPAASTMDGKDRVLGEGVSGAARRRGAVHRKGDRWEEGDFGQKERDYLA